MQKLANDRKARSKGGTIPHANDFSGASPAESFAAQAYYHLPPAGEQAVPVVPDIDFHKALTFVGQHGVLQRALGLVFDLLVPVKNVRLLTNALNTDVFITASLQLPTGAPAFSPGYSSITPRTQCDASTTVFEPHAVSSDITGRQLTVGDPTSFLAHVIDFDGAGLRASNFATQIRLTESPAAIHPRYIARGRRSRADDTDDAADDPLEWPDADTGESRGHVRELAGPLVPALRRGRQQQPGPRPDGRGPRARVRPRRFRRGQQHLALHRRMAVHVQGRFADALRAVVGAVLRVLDPGAAAGSELADRSELPAGKRLRGAAPLQRLEQRGATAGQSDPGRRQPGHKSQPNPVQPAHDRRSRRRRDGYRHSGSATPISCARGSSTSATTRSPSTPQRAIPSRRRRRWCTAVTSRSAPRMSTGRASCGSPSRSNGWLSATSMAQADSLRALAPQRCPSRLPSGTGCSTTVSGGAINRR